MSGQNSNYFLLCLLPYYKFKTSVLCQKWCWGCLNIWGNSGRENLVKGLNGIGSDGKWFNNTILKLNVVACCLYLYVFNDGIESKVV